MDWIRAISLATSLLGGGPRADVPRAGIATTYDPHEPGGLGGGDRVGCPAWALATYGTRRLTVLRRRAARRDGLAVVAMRAELAACGERVRIITPRGQVEALAGDRGPWGVSCPGRAWSWSTRLPRGCRWRGIVDLPPSAAAVLLPGRGRLDRRGMVLVVRLGPKNEQPAAQRARMPVVALYAADDHE